LVTDNEQVFFLEELFPVIDIEINELGSFELFQEHNGSDATLVFIFFD
jgi:hypothetical protein